MDYIIVSGGQSNDIGDGTGVVGATDLPAASNAWTIEFGSPNQNCKIRPWHFFDSRQTFDEGSGTRWTGTDMVAVRGLENAGHRVAVVKVASGASSLVEHWNFEWPTGRGYTSELTYQFTQAFASVARPFDWQGAYRTILYWDQSETDATNDTDTNLYGANLTSFVATLRATAGLEQMKCVIIQLHTDNPNVSRMPVIRAAQAAFVAADSGRSVLVDPSDLALDPDHLHRPAATRVTLGQRVATAMLAL